MTVTVRLADSIAFPAHTEWLATWETVAPPVPGDVLLVDGTVHEVEGRLWRGANEVCCSLSRRP